MPYLSYYFQAVKKHLNLFVIGYYTAGLRLPELGPPSYDLHKISDTQSILMYHSALKA